MDFSSFFDYKGINVAEVQKLAGGDINYVFRYQDEVFKINLKEDFPEMFEAEAKGLKLLSKACLVPDVIEVAHFKNLQILQLKHVSSGSKSSNFWLNFGRDLAELHQLTDAVFGLDSNNYIGSLRQRNNTHDNWVDFLIEERLQPMLEMAVNSGEVNYIEAKLAEDFYHRIEEIYPEEKPTLIHGDLWGGNFICSEKEQACLIDPAVYYGHREMDIGMMHLFGGFDPILFEEYNTIFPLESKWKSRIAINQLYPLLVHLNLFGRGYWKQIKDILEPFGKTR
jgi:fructosamine-3-kinase